MRLSYRTILLFLLIVLPLGILEGIYGRVDYSGDAIPYLDMARAIHAGDWKLAFNPLWGLGYALLIAAAQSLFANTGQGEWIAVHCLNLVIYAAAYASFVYLLAGIVAIASKEEAEGEAPYRLSNQVLLSGTALFLSAELCMDTVSRVGPDVLVTTFVLLSLGLLLRLLYRPNRFYALLLGASLGCGYIVKTIFLPLSLVIIVITVFALFRRRGKPAVMGITIACAALIAAPYVAGLSWSMGRFSMGESGILNYAWHVNRLLLIHWQGGPAQFGQPLHPTSQLLADPPIYAFSEPFHVSYPPFFNPPYYYEGYHHFFDKKLQVRAIAANLLHLVQALRTLAMAYCVGICLLLILFLRERHPAQGREWLRETCSFWPILLPAAAGIALYVQVHLEGRYLPAFLLVLAVVPITVFFVRASEWPKQLSAIVFALLLAGCVATLATVNKPTWEAARHHVRYSDSQQWVLARFLVQHGLQPGDPVAVIGGPANHCTWAHVDHLRIVSELAADLYATPGEGTKMFWEATPAKQQQMLNLFAGTGAKLVISQAGDTLAPGWTPVPGTNVVIHDLN